jgi:hypothetical protein
VRIFDAQFITERACTLTTTRMRMETAPVDAKAAPGLKSCIVHREPPIRIETFPEQLRSSSAFTLARSIFQAAEGRELFDQQFVFASAVSTYYSLFHLGGSLILAYCCHPTSTEDPHASMRNALEENWRKSRSRGSSNTGRYGFPDPAKDIRHQDVPAFLERELPEAFRSLGNSDRRGTLRDMRDFVSYAPRMVSDGQTNCLWSGCHYEAQDFKQHLKQHLGQFEGFFHNSLQWLSQNRCNEVCMRILSGDFILFEFDALRCYHPSPVVKRAWAIYRSVCERERVDWRIYRGDPNTWRTDEAQQRQRYAEMISTQFRETIQST